MADNLITATDLMPKEAWQIELLNSRAKKLAEKQTTSQNAEKQQLCLQFKLNADEVYAIPQPMLDEVVYAHHLVNLTWLPAFISGVIPWKGMILTVLDGNYLCNRQTTTVDELSRVIVLTHQGQAMGLLVNELCNFVNYKPSQLKTSLQSPLTFNSHYFLGLLDCAVVFFNVEAIFNDSNLRISHQQ